MIIGVPKEIKNNENRVGITPAGTASLVKAGHQVIIERLAGMDSGYTNEEYEAAGARMLDQAADIWSQRIWS